MAWAKLEVRYSCWVCMWILVGYPSLPNGGPRWPMKSLMPTMRGLTPSMVGAIPGTLGVVPSLLGVIVCWGVSLAW